eukprot:CCRYP_003155-RB/>CCRYP_003155-RB protein AED:0.07 eAED:0.07 QI:33/1/1/1/1/1/12/1130/1233
MSNLSANDPEDDRSPEGTSHPPNRRYSLQANRPDYLQSLRRASVPSLRLESYHEKNTASATNDNNDEDSGDDDRVIDIPSLQRQFASLRQFTQSPLRRVIVEEVEVRMKEYSYRVPVRVDAPSIKTVLNTSPCYVMMELGRNLLEIVMGRKKVQDIFGHYEDHWILRDINLVLKPGKTYLVMGPPGCGKTSLLKAIAGRISKSSSRSQGTIEYNGVSLQDEPNMILQNIVSYVGQLDEHAPFLTVQETFDFATNCRNGPKSKKAGADESEEVLSENLTIDGLDLAVCRETFVGDANHRGVSGGQRRRVSVGEMLVGQNPVACADEISTGLDAAVTYDICNSIVKFAKAAGTTRLVSLLQPGPETFSLFDDVILLAEGRLVYAGPIEDAAEYFASLGYRPPPTMDIADFLQSVTTPDGAMMFDAEKSPKNEHYSATDFADAFRSSERYDTIVAEQSKPLKCNWSRAKLETVDEENHEDSSQSNSHILPEEIKRQYINSFWTNTMLNVKRHLTLLKRDKEFLIGKCIENFGMGIGMALIFLQAAAFPSSINGSENVAAYFEQGCQVEDLTDEVATSYDKLLAGTYSSIFLTAFHILLGTLTGTPDEVDGRGIYYKHADARFYQAGAFLLGRQISQLPLLAMEIVAFGLPFYLISGLAYEVRAFFVYLAILVAYKFALKMLYGVLAQVCPKKANVQGIGTFLYLLLTLTGGFIVYPTAIPRYWIWLFWANPMAWVIQGMASNQFLSSKYDGYACYINGSLITLGESALENPRGWQSEGGRVWIGYTFAFLLPYTLLFGVVTWLAMKYIRIEPDRQLVDKVNIGKVKKSEEFSIPFIPVDLSFDSLVYEVTASTSKEKLRLLNEVSGVFRSGRMCALMGSSGAGKTTLMDVIAMRKISGSITGKIELNGFGQERISFLRSSGYVEQFDVQQPELTVRETVAFSARLRLDVKSPAIGDDSTKMKFVDHVLEIMELTDIQTLQVGSFEEGGLTFEQRKRLAIACELAGSPSVLFLDEPTSGLDSRGALVVIRAMRRIADSGRTVVATIHQPSAAVFEMFDDLILLKKGGNVVFFGELGDESTKMVKYFEDRGAKLIERQENPAAWVLRTFASENSSHHTDWAELYKSSEQFSIVQKQIASIRDSSDVKNKVTFSSTFSTPMRERIRLTCQRMSTIYRRSAPYNMTRIVVWILYASLLGSIFISSGLRKESDSWTEDQAAALIGTVFLSLNVVGTTGEHK